MNQMFYMYFLYLTRTDPTNDAFFDKSACDIFIKWII